MQFRHLLAGLGALFLLSGAAHAQPSGISQKVGVCDVKTPTNCIKPNSDGSINVSGGGVITNYALETGGNLAASKADLDSIVAGLSNPVPLAAGSSIVGKVGIDQTTPGTTNNVTLSTNVGTLPLVQATASAAVSTSSAATLQVVAASGSTVIRVTHWELITTLANNVTWESADTGGSCANPVALSGAMPFAANGGASAGGGLGPVLVLPSGKALCMLTSAATQISGSVAYAQF